ncbi:hypothetical protein GMST_36680 [Geomonas silvestris]|uniref:Lipoprotein n=1 Tax=Geomonas silvestris TaxID=2740184 RepID=A0A6V8MNQ4_9BACT|nr:hypothetical protein GMST_36680 [Geomonas silvestris]
MRGVMFRCVMLVLAVSVAVLAGCGSTVTDKTGQSQDVRLVAASTEFPNAGLLVTGESLHKAWGRGW